MLRCVFLFSFTILVFAQDGCEEKVRQKRTLAVDVDTFKQQCLERHNLYRSWYGVQALEISDQLNTIAQNYADELASKNHPELKHSSGRIGTFQYGENLYYYKRPMNGHRAVDKWFEEYKLYNFNMDNPPNFVQVGHFTQLVWAATTHLGIGVATSKTGRTYVVCTYNPRGNLKNQFKQNVFPPMSDSNNLEVKKVRGSIECQVIPETIITKSENSELEELNTNHSSDSSLNMSSQSSDFDTSSKIRNEEILEDIKNDLIEIDKKKIRLLQELEETGRKKIRLTRELEQYK